MVEFKAWPKIPRDKGNRVVITEKIDGTNGCIVIQEGEIVAVQSRKRFITPEDDNYNFAAWVAENQEELLKMGDGYHYGEWAGEGIQKNPHDLTGKHFFLFNTRRWGGHNPNTPECCKVVPVLYDGKDQPGIIEMTMDDLFSSYKDILARPEGVVVFYPAFDKMVKYTFENVQGKWKSS